MKYTQQSAITVLECFLCWRFFSFPKYKKKKKKRTSLERAYKTHFKCCRCSDKNVTVQSLADELLCWQFSQWLELTEGCLCMWRLVIHNTYILFKS